jgi:hypothetical protein
MRADFRATRAATPDPHGTISGRTRRVRVPGRVAAVTGILAAVLSFPAAVPAQGTQIIPSVGLTRAVDGDEARASAGLAVRAPLLAGALDAEVGVSYRSQQYYGGSLTVRSWPLTASAWFTPMGPIYVGGGLGWYNTSYHYPGGTGGQDRTTQKLGLHLGGGVQLPLGSSVSLDMAGRYIFLGSEDSGLFDQRYNPDSWMTSVGLAFHPGRHRDER